MSIYFSLIETKEVEVFKTNITFTLANIGVEAGIFTCFTSSGKSAKEIIDPLKEGIANLKANPGYFKQFDSSRWGTYEDLVPWLEKVLKACIENPAAQISTS